MLLSAMLLLTSFTAEETELPKEIAAPPGAKVLFQTEAKGVQIYKAAASKEGRLEWVLEAPLAALVDDRGRPIGRHYEGPAWEAADGSEVVRDKTAEVRSAPAPKRNEDILWLLVKVRREDDKGARMNGVAYVQRIHTRGGKPPADPPLRLGTKIGVAYTATYRFLSRGE